MTSLLVFFQTDQNLKNKSDCRIFGHRIFGNRNSPPELKSWLKDDKLQDLNFNLRSSGSELGVPAFSKTKFGDLRFRNIFANYVNF